MTKRKYMCAFNPHLKEMGIPACDCKGLFKKWAYLDEILPKIE